MKTTIIKIGNSKGIRIPKKFLEETNLSHEADMTIEKGVLVIRAIKPSAPDGGIVLSRSALAKEWDSPQEDEAWALYQ